MARFREVLVACPEQPLTAGPEALHQLVARLNALGQPASIVYIPFDRAIDTPQPYRHHGAPVARFADRPGSLLLFPEVFTRLALGVRHASVAIWWMSVNNFTGQRYRHPVRERLLYLFQVAKGDRPARGARALTHLRHFAQSDYAASYLAARGIASQPLSDPIPVYTEPGYLAGLPARLHEAERGDTILYNPVKGAHITRRLVRAYPGWRFEPLQHLDRAQLAQAFLRSKLYIDFGHHPGKDRLPREAALHGCCVVCANHGSAANPVDVPIDPSYKLDVKHPQFTQAFGRLAADIFGRFDAHAARFDAYRQTIREEPAAFDRQIITAFDLPDPSRPAG